MNTKLNDIYVLANILWCNVERWTYFDINNSAFTNKYYKQAELILDKIKEEEQRLLNHIKDLEKQLKFMQKE